MLKYIATRYTNLTKSMARPSVIGVFDTEEKARAHVIHLLVECFELFNVGVERTISTENLEFFASTSDGPVIVKYNVEAIPV